MMEIQKDIDLYPFNTFKIHALARYLAVVRTPKDAQDIFRSEMFSNNRSMILGGGSNILLTGDFDGLVIKNEILGREILEETGTSITLKVGAGENWHQLVLFCVDRNYGGIENLSLIPGTVGAAPMQNIGAYGVEIKDVIHRVESIEIETGSLHSFTREECRFGYRESIFKQELKGRHFISSVTLSLTKTNHRFNTSYGAIGEVLKAKNQKEPTLRAISDAVIDIRRSKLPDPEVIGNAGSFFKNPSVEPEKFALLKKEYPTLPSFPGEHGGIKIPAAWLIEQCGWKGKTLENIGVHKHQALVLVNYGGGDGKKILHLAKDIQLSVMEKFGINLHPEVNVV